MRYNLEECRKFYAGKRVLVTGHTGFKGTWLCRILMLAGAKVTGYSLNPPTEPSVYGLLDMENSGMTSVIGDVRDLAQLRKVFEETEPEIVLHLAAQPIVRDSYREPVYTYETNVMGTVNLLECVRLTPSVKSVLNVTTDKVYENREWEYGYRECDPLDGYDPYSNSKSCSELVTHSYQKSFFQERDCAISTARAGNVIGGGDFANDRIIPDCVRATTGQLVTMFCELWGDGAAWENQSENGPHEANFLKLDCSKIKHVFGWRPRWHIREALDKTVEWSKAYLEGQELQKVTDRQILEY